MEEEGFLDLWIRLDVQQHVSWDKLNQPTTTMINWEKDTQIIQRMHRSNELIRRAKPHARFNADSAKKAWLDYRGSTDHPVIWYKRET